MKRLGLLFAALLLACNSSDDGDTDSSNNSGSGGTGSSSSSTDPTDSATASETANTDSASASGTTTGSSTTTDSDSDESSEGSSSSTGEGSSTGSSSSTGEADPQQLCEDTAGTWDEAACGDYVCGVPNDCEAIIPGCDCGPDANFVEGEGCVVDDACATFNCEDEVECSVGTEYCEIGYPGVKGAPPTYTCLPMPEECLDMVDCPCLNAALMLPPPPLCTEPTEDGLIVEVFGV
ncbi:MAG: hypothetical protein ACE37F_13980 [Nannocystaceae bacterium]|nr:hypothetical protein [bacterium]